MKQRILLILDVDETLVHAKACEFEQQSDFVLFNLCVYKRPYLDEFLLEAERHFDLGIWSSGTNDYVKGIVIRIFPKPGQLKFIWDRSKCIESRKGGGWIDEKEIYYVKDLDKLAEEGFRKEKILIVDDDPRTAEGNVENAIFVKEFTGDQADRELLYLKEYLTTLVNVEDVRKIEKRTWRSHF